MNIREVADEHPELLAAILAASSGPLGEILAARELQRRGCQVAILSNNWRQRDLQIVTPGGRTVFVETKTVRSKGSPWIVNAPPDPERSAIWILIHAPRMAEGLPKAEDVRFFVLTAGEALAAWKKPTTVGDIAWNRLPVGCEDAFSKLD